MTTKAAREAAAAQPVEPQAQDGAPTEQPISLPSPNIIHSAVLVSELENRRHQFETMIIAMQGERQGQIEAYNRDRAELDGKHAVSLEDLDRRLADLSRGHDILEAAIDKAQMTAPQKPAPVDTSTLNDGN